MRKNSSTSEYLRNLKAMGRVMKETTKGRNFLRVAALAMVAVLVFTVEICSCSEVGRGNRNSNVSRLESLRKEAVDAYMKGSLKKSDSLGSILYKEAVTDRNDIYEAYGLLVLGFPPKSGGDADKRLNFVRQAEKKALLTDNDTLLSWVYNVLGIYATIHIFNFSEARQYYTEAIKYAKRGNVNHFRISAECNISELYYTFGDTLGIKYDLDIYKYSKESGSPHLLVASARRIAEYYINKKGEEKMALPYINDIRNAGNAYQSKLVKGKYYFALDSLDKAKREFESALRSDTLSPNIYLEYARLLNTLGDYSKSNLYLDTAYNSYKEIDSHGFDYIQTLRLYSDNMRRLGNDKEALRFLEQYIIARDSVNNLRNREEINSYKVKFDVEKKELELARNRETMRRQNITIWAVGIVVTLCVCFFLMFNYRKRRMNRLIVRQHREYMLQNRNLVPVSAPADQPSVPTEPESTYSDTALPTSPYQRVKLSQEKSDAIWDMIVHEMDDNKIYTDANLTRDTFSERIGCNHTWFSQVIKDKTGKSYLQFINSRRVTEAVKILSDPTSDVPIKSLVFTLGFTSISTFYSAFRQQVGMSPAEFRKLSLKDS